MLDDAVAERPATLDGSKAAEGVGESQAGTVDAHVPAPAAAHEEAAAPVRVFSRGEYRYPALGDGKPGGGEPVTLLTLGGVPVSGCWQDDGRYVAWCPLPVRDRVKEQLLRDMGKRI